MEDKAAIETEEEEGADFWHCSEDEENNESLPAAVRRNNWSEQDALQLSHNSSNNGATRKRRGSWSPKERKHFHAVVWAHLDVVQDKANDVATLAKKQRAWTDIHQQMTAAGYTRSALTLRNAWSRRLALEKAVALTKQSAASPAKNSRAYKFRSAAKGHAMQSAEMHFLRKKLLEKRIEAQERRLAHTNLLIEKDAIIKSLEIQKLKLSMNLVA